MLNEAGARSIAPQKLPANRAEQCSALRRVASFAEVTEYDFTAHFST
jgi:hypothetical protein